MKKRILSLAVAAAVLFSNPAVLHAAELTGGTGTSEEILPLQDGEPVQGELFLPEEQTAAEKVTALSGNAGEERQGEQDGWSWALENGVLTVRGTGRVSAGRYPDYEVPWEAYKEEIQEVIVEEGIWEIGWYAFANLENLRTVTLPGSVRKIGPHAFYYCRALEQINLPESVTEIGDYAFAMTDALKQIALPSGLEELADDLFYGGGLEAVVLPEGVLSIGSGAFYGTALKEVEIPQSVLAIESDAFAFCEELVSVQFPEAIAERGSAAAQELGRAFPYLGTGAFRNCGSLTGTIRIPENVYEISRNAFANTAVTGIRIPASVTELGCAFNGCVSLESMEFGEGSSYFLEEGCLYERRTDGSRRLIYVMNSASGEKTFSEEVTELEAYAFYDSGYTKVTVPGTVRTVPERCFDESYDGQSQGGLEEIVLEEGVLRIESGAFRMKSLRRVVIPASVQDIAEDAFSYSYKKNVTIYGYAGSAAELYAAEQEMAFSALDPDAAVQRVFFDANGGTVTVSSKEICGLGLYGELPVPVKNGANFAGWYTEAEGGELVSAHTSSAFVRPEGGTLYAHWSDSPVYAGEVEGYLCEWIMDTGTGVLSFSGTGTLYMASVPEEWETWKGQVRQLTVGEGITGLAVSNSSPYGSQGMPFDEFPIVSASLPDSLELLGTAFRDCSTLEEVTLPGGLRSISPYAFYGCTGLKRIEIPGTVKSIGNRAFSGCTALEEVIMEEGVQELNEISFDECTSLKSVFLPASVRQIYNAFRGCPERITISGDNPYLEADEYAVYSKGKTDLLYCLPGNTGEFAVPGTVTDIAGFAFAASQLSKVTVHGGIAKIPMDCFLFCDNLTEIVLEEGIRQIGKYGINSCGMLKEIVLPDSLEQMDDDAVRDEKVVIVCGQDTTGHTYAQQFGRCFRLTDTAPGTLFFDTCGGTAEISEKSLTKGSCFGELPVPVRENYEFEGWYTQAEGGVPVSEMTLLTQESQTLYARWKGKNRWVSFDAGEGAVWGKSGKYVAYGEAWGILPEAQREGYRLEGWYTAPEGGERITADSTVAITRDVTLYAHWQKAVSYRLVFDANGGSVNPAGKIVVRGDAYGELPTPGLDDHTFIGWYTERTGGTEVTALSIVGDTATLYARWKPLHTYYYVAYDAKGGTISGSASKRVTAGESYGTLASPRREGYRFDGWYTKSAGGERITAESLVTITQDVTLYAHWTANTYRITFNANGGTVSPGTKTVTYDKAYGALPVAEREGYIFMGWSESADGSTFVASDTVCRTAADQTLYACWQARRQGDYTLDSLSYSFGNSNRAYGYSANYKIPLERYQFMYGNTQQAYTYYRQSSVWGGNCFGMSSTSAMLLTEGNGVNLTDFRSGASKASSLSVRDSNAALGLNLTQFIEAMQISQKKSLIQKDLGRSGNVLDEIVREVKEVGKTGYPVLIAVYSAQGGHALLAYRFEEMDSTTGRIYVYDCNYPNQTRYITVKKNQADTAASTGKYTAFSYRINDAYLCIRIKYVDYETFYQVWRERGGSSEANLLSVSTDNIKIYDSAGRLAAELKDGELVTEREDIYEVTEFGVTDEGEVMPDDGRYELYLPAGEKFTVENTDSYQQEFEAELVGEDLKAGVSTNAGEVTFAMDQDTGENAVDVEAEEGDLYEITLQSMADGDAEEVSVTGAGEGETVSVSSQKGEVGLEGEGALLEINGEAYPDVAVTASAGAGGTISNAGRREYQYRSYQDYTITPDAGYKIQDVLVDGVSVGAVSRYGFAELVYPHTIEAKFVKVQQAGGQEPGQKPSIQPPDGNSLSSPPPVGTVVQDYGTGAKYKVKSSSAVEYVKPLKQNTTSVKIPKQVVISGGVYKVTSVAANAFAGCKKLKSVTLGSQVTEIGAKAFSKCTALTKITIPAKVSRIGKKAFYGCKKLKNITIKTKKLTAKSVGSQAFKGIYAKVSIKVPKTKRKAYRKLLKAKGAGTKAKIK